ncbi:MAG: PPOX class F420-dependent oxidoreductase [Acidimicrobiales bacterium]
MTTAADEIRAFLDEHHRTVLVTRRSGDRLQSSPVLAATDDDGHIVVSATEDRSKVRNLRRDPRVALCAFTDGFFGPWVQADGTAEIVSLPGAMDGLVALYRRVAGEHEDWDDYRRGMIEEHRVLIRITLDD